MNAYFPSVRVAAGDLDYDGRANEFAFIRTGRGDDYYLEVCRVSGNLTLKDFPMSAPHTFSNIRHGKKTTNAKWFSFLTSDRRAHV